MYPNKIKSNLNQIEGNGYSKPKYWEDYYQSCIICKKEFLVTAEMQVQRHEVEKIHYTHPMSYCKEHIKTKELAKKVNNSINLYHETKTDAMSCILTIIELFKYINSKQLEQARDIHSKLKFQNNIEQFELYIKNSEQFQPKSSFHHYE